MDILSALTDTEWDAPFFKKLAKNDTSDGGGNQAGAVIPVDLRKYMPAIDESNLSRMTPTVERRIKMEMYDGSEYQATASVRYQFQTWGGKRGPEGRITDGFQPLHSISHADDILIFQRHTNSLNNYRLMLVRKGTEAYKDVNRMTGGKRWGLLYKNHSPATDENLISAVSEMDNLVNAPFKLRTPEVTRQVSRQMKLARGTIFRQRVCSEYNYTCAISGNAIASPESRHEVEAAHVVPVSKGGTDDVRNGLALTRTLHWAFDQGLFGIDGKRTVYVPGRVLEIEGNFFLKQFCGKKISNAVHSELNVHKDALEWQMENCVRTWK